MDDITDLQKVVAEQSRKLEEQYDVLKDLTQGQATIDKAIARNEQQTTARFDTNSAEIKTMMTILMGLDAKLGNINMLLPKVANKDAPTDPSTPPRVVRGAATMDMDSDEDVSSADTYSKALTEVERRVNNRPTKIPPSGDQKRPPKESPAKRTLRAANRKSARTYQQADVSYPSGDRSYSSHGSGTPTPSRPQLAPIFQLVPSQVRGAVSDDLEVSPWWDLPSSDPEHHTDVDAFPDRLGDALHDCHEDHVRIMFGNINGLQLSDRGQRLRQIFREINMLQANHVGMAEINTNTAHSGAIQLMYDTAREEFEHSILTPATSQTPCQSLYKPGGILSITRENLVGRLSDKGYDDMGRWSYCKYAGKLGKVVTIVTIYQVCSRPTNEFGNTAYHQQVQQMAQQALDANQTIQSPQPRIRFRTDLLRFLRACRRAGESLILMGDFNEDIGSGDSKLQCLFQDQDLRLIDIIGRCHPSTQQLPTYIRGSKRLDFVLITSDLIPAVRKCGYLPYHSHFRSDHRFAFIDFDNDILFGSGDATLAGFLSRELSSKDSHTVAKYLRLKHQYLVDQNFFPRLEELSKQETPDFVMAELLDSCWVEASFYAAKKCKKRRREWWSIPLHQALEEKALLQSHLTSLRTGHDLSLSIDTRIKKYNLPAIHFPDTLDDTKAALRSVQARIRQIRQQSKSVREQSLIDQVRDSAYRGKKSDAEILEMMKKKEALAERWRRMGFLQGKRRTSQFTKVQVPVSWPTTEAEFLNPDRPLENPKECEFWRTIEDPTEVEFYIQMRNRLHFGQAHGTPFTVGSLHSALDWSATSPAADDILDGNFHIPPDEYCTFDEDEVETPQHTLLQEFLSSCQRSPTQRSQPLILPEISLPDLVSRIRVWNERTTTSPS
eukprot:scaffold5640_cov132-Cylindrotheca_fusiformis.AAC.1